MRTGGLLAFLRIVVLGNTVVDGGEGFANGDNGLAIRADKIKSVADSLAYTINTQVLPVFNAARFGEESILTGGMLEWDVSRPKDLEAEARSLLTSAQAIQAWKETLAGFGRSLDIDELSSRFGVPINGDHDGDGAPDNGEPDDIQSARKVVRLRDRGDAFLRRRAA